MRPDWAGCDLCYSSDGLVRTGENPEQKEHNRVSVPSPVQLCFCAFWFEEIGFMVPVARNGHPKFRVKTG